MRRDLRPGVVSVVVVDDGALHPALTSLPDAGLPPALLHVVVVRDPDTPLPQAAHVDVLVNEADGVPLRRSRGADASTGEFTAFVSGSVALPRGALASLVDTLHRETRTGAVGPGRAEKAAAGGEGHSPKAVDVLSVPLDVVVVRTAAWREVGGLSAPLGGVLDDVDLGWRLWLTGYAVRRRCDVVVPMPQSTVEPARAERARTTMLVRNVSDAVLDEWHETADERDRALLPPLLTGRRAVQSRRRADDRDLLALVQREDLGDVPDPAVERALGGRACLPMRRRVLVVTGDTLGARMAGPAIRAWEMAHALAAEHEVVLAAIGGCTLASSTVDCRAVGVQELLALEQWCDVLVFQGFLLRDVPQLEDSRKVLVADMYDPIHLEVLEQEKHGDQERRGASLAAAVEVVNQQLRRADFFLCASPRQRDLWIGHLASLGRVNPATYDGDEDLAGLLAIVPFGTASEPPPRRRPVMKGVVPGIGVDDKVVLWGGGIYNWFDPLTLLLAVDRVRAVRDDVRLYFLGTKHPNPAVPAMRMAASARELAERLGLTGTHVFFNEDWVPYEDRGQYLLESDVGVSCHYRHIETEFSFRTRILDYIWAGLPIITTEGDVFADLVRDRDLGVAVPPEDVDALAAALLRLLDDDAERARCAGNVRAIAGEHTWERSLEPLVRFCRAPRPAADRAPAGVPDPAAQLRRPPRTLATELALVREYLAQGGASEVVRRASGRVRRQVRSRVGG